MKKLLVCAALLISGLASAQKGSVLVGGNIGFASDKVGEAKSTSFEFNPKIGYQFADKWTAGVEGYIASVDSDWAEKTEKYKIGGFVRYTQSLSETFAVFADLGAGYQNESVNDAKGMYVNLIPNLFINMKNGFGLNFSIGGIGYNNLDGRNDERRESFGFDFGKTFNIGISKNFAL
ncbi:outer membrane beta-barrel protein [Flavobacterium sp. GA093]|uniref:Outer membrane beta-barrel protein n=1 Tax=Flavobacterium hydrocarbonoxydans TaxID=2683249 RepID=A0A6I4NN77_9FLAO|nr:outer membrane beta-barrel protein [Flavobacterium hydrocarbonoxydans]MWB94412.1 outer membrane beta-barrel protein [Flavobacterium hydrocarbonoxydans]